MCACHMICSATLDSALLHVFEHTVPQLGGFGLFDNNSSTQQEAECAATEGHLSGADGSPPRNSKSGGPSIFDIFTGHED